MPSKKFYFAERAKFRLLDYFRLWEDLWQFPNSREIRTGSRSLFLAGPLTQRWKWKTIFLSKGRWLCVGDPTLIISPQETERFKFRQPFNMDTFVSERLLFTFSGVAISSSEYKTRLVVLFPIKLSFYQLFLTEQKRSYSLGKV